MRTRKSFTLAALFMIAAGVFASYGQQPDKPQPMTETERSVRAFYDDYAADLREHKRESIADRYDRRGVYMVGNGHKSLDTYENIKNRYLTKWNGPKAFSWKDLSVEVVSKNSAVVTALFEWQAASGQTFNYSYSALLLKIDGKWRIRVEDESSSPK